MGTRHEIVAEFEEEMGGGIGEESEKSREDRALY
jgi:hypothetical protein